MSPSLFLLQLRKELLMNNLLKILKNYSMIVLSIFVILFSLIFVFFNIKGSLSDRKELQTKEELNRLYGIKIEILKYQNSKQLNENMTNTLLALPSSYDSPSLLNALEKLGSASGVTFYGLQVSQVSGVTSAAISTESVSPSTFSLSTTADYSHAIAMLRNFENTLPLFNVTNLTVRSAGASNELAIAFGLSTYYQSLPATLGTQDQPITDLTPEEKDLLTALESYRNYPLVPDTSGIGKTNPFD